MPLTGSSSLTCCTPISASPRATTAPTSSPGFGATRFATTTSAMPSFSITLTKCMPLAPVLYDTVRAASRTFFSFSGELMSGFGAPARTANPVVERANAVRLPACSLPSFKSGSENSSGPMNRSPRVPLRIWSARPVPPA
jgi:hypothetical protein